jgi:uncharacterized iron-regulated membrane protein
MLRWHRLCAFLIFPLLAYVVVTGSGIQAADMVALVSHAPETDPDMLMMRQHINGTDNYSVVSAPDYAAPALPADLNYADAIQKTATLGRQAVPGADLRLVELRNAEGRVAGHVQMDSRQLIFDLASGAQLSATDLPPPPPPREFKATRATFKFFHRSNFLGPFGPALNGIAGIGLSILIITGLVQYTRLYRARARINKRGVFWRGGGSWWRDLHRWVAVSASLLVLWVAVTGLLLSFDNVAGPVTRMFHSGAGNGPPRGPNPMDSDLSTPLQDAELPEMTRVTLASFHALEPNTNVKVFRLRYFSGYSQGVVVAADSDTSQLVFNARTGARMSMSEKGYPTVGFPFGWELHQRMKRLHRGDFFGMPGRWLDSLAAVAMLYLLISGGVMYTQLLVRRAKSGRRELIWK